MPSNQWRRSNSENSVYKTTFPARNSFNIGIQQKTHLQEIFKQTSRKPAAIWRRASTLPTLQDGQQVRIRRGKLSETTKNCRIVGDSPEGSNNVAWHPNITTPKEACSLACRQLKPILLDLPNDQPPPQYSPACTPRADGQPSRRPLLQQTGQWCLLPKFNTLRCTAHSRSRHRPKQTREARRNYPSISLRKLRNDCTTLTKIYIICVLLWLSINNPTVTHKRMETCDKIVHIHTDSQITLQLLQNKKKKPTRTNLYTQGTNFV